ncbi:hypothetical protein INT45_004119 [Circinella minor]|uniref:Uncharacterized protein n=1 Tax=Circinella minor TaxID=1195481 RepID=A0A8H7RPC1_9FUNG|nr:hypothetical protein INT45_004119 [Circinella minor]
MANHVPESEQQWLYSLIDTEDGDYKPRTIEEDALAAYLEERQRLVVEKLQFWKDHKEAASGIKDANTVTK